MYQLDPAVVEDAKRQAELDAKRFEADSAHFETYVGDAKGVNGNAEHLEAAT